MRICTEFGKNRRSENVMLQNARFAKRGPSFAAHLLADVSIGLRERTRDVNKRSTLIAVLGEKQLKLTKITSACENRLFLIYAVFGLPVVPTSNKCLQFGVVRTFLNEN